MLKLSLPRNLLLKKSLHLILVLSLLLPDSALTFCHSAPAGWTRTGRWIALDRLFSDQALEPRGNLPYLARQEDRLSSRQTLSVTQESARLSRLAQNKMRVVRTPAPLSDVQDARNLLHALASDRDVYDFFVLLTHGRMAEPLPFYRSLKTRDAINNFAGYEKIAASLRVFLYVDGRPSELRRLVDRPAELRAALRVIPLMQENGRFPGVPNGGFGPDELNDALREARAPENPTRQGLPIREWIRSLTEFLSSLWSRRAVRIALGATLVLLLAVLLFHAVDASSMFAHPAANIVAHSLPLPHVSALVTPTAPHLSTIAQGVSELAVKDSVNTLVVGKGDTVSQIAQWALKKGLVHGPLYGHGAAVEQVWALITNQSADGKMWLYVGKTIDLSPLLSANPLSASAALPPLTPISPLAFSAPDFLSIPHHFFSAALFFPMTLLFGRRPKQTAPIFRGILTSA